jgi:hypothetical protein
MSKKKKWKFSLMQSLEAQEVGVAPGPTAAALLKGEEDVEGGEEVPLLHLKLAPRNARPLTVQRRKHILNLNIR